MADETEAESTDKVGIGLSPIADYHDWWHQSWSFCSMTLHSVNLIVIFQLKKLQIHGEKQNAKEEGEGMICFG